MVVIDTVVAVSANAENDIIASAMSADSATTAVVIDGFDTVFAYSIKLQSLNQFVLLPLSLLLIHVLLMLLWLLMAAVAAYSILAAIATVISSTTVIVVNDASAVVVAAATVLFLMLLLLLFRPQILLRCKSLFQ